jgi:dihydrofolate reductase
MMGRIIVYIATSFDGFIARKDDDISWLDSFSNGSEDYGYPEFMNNVGTAIMGSRTYEESLRHPDRLLTGVKNYILTTRSLPGSPGIITEFWNRSPADLVSTIRRESAKDIYVVGGGKVISRFIGEGLVDEIRQFIVPVILGDGIPLYTGIGREIGLRRLNVLSYPNGIVQVRYSLNNRPVM